MTKHGSGFCITGKKGFHVSFKNGWTVSVQFGPGNYCEHHDRDIGHDEEACGREGSYDAETAVWGPDGQMRCINNSGETVQAYQSPEDVCKLLEFAANGGKTLAVTTDE